MARNYRHTDARQITAKFDSVCAETGKKISLVNNQGKNPITLACDGVVVVEETDGKKKLVLSRTYLDIRRIR